jgi:hypothetical protein
MSNRTVVSVESGFDDQLGVRLMMAPGKYPNPLRIRPFPYTPDEFPSWTVEGAVAKYGRLLHQKLTDAHTAVHDALENSLRASPGDVHPVYFMITADPAEGLHWEALCTDEGSFMALDRRWPIGRIAHSGRDWWAGGPRPFTPPLRVLAVISALGVGGRPEWRRLYEAVQRVRQAGLPVQLRVLVGEEPLLEELRALPAGEVEFATLQGSSEELEREVNVFSPQILHFFCHGTSSFGSRLEFATIADRDDDRRTTGSVVLSAEQLVNLPAMKNLWLVTLNCCEGARPGGEVRSLAHTLVAEGGVPAVVGMAEPINASDAHAFCGAFYGAILEDIRFAVQAGRPTEVEWARGLYSPRRQLAEAHPDAAQNREWLLPVLYVGVTPFSIQAMEAPETPAARDRRVREAIVEELVRMLPMEAPAPFIEDVRALPSSSPKASGGS